mmetsp:Transcript_17074/g.32449  ORF Transcript_17074/g.32449 Transcript_17074/m.32449 type:complete len:320 (-) Transcript_17074:161-1120(-)
MLEHSAPGANIEKDASVRRWAGVRLHINGTEEARAIYGPPQPLLQSVRQWVVHEYRSNVDKFVYKDADGVNITVTTELEIQEALQYQRPGNFGQSNLFPLYIYIRRSFGSTSPLLGNIDEDPLRFLSEPFEFENAARLGTPSPTSRRSSEPTPSEQKEPQADILGSLVAPNNRSLRIRRINDESSTMKHRKKYRKLNRTNLLKLTEKLTCDKQSVAEDLSRVEVHIRGYIKAQTEENKKHTVACCFCGTIIKISRENGKSEPTWMMNHSLTKKCRENHQPALMPNDEAVTESYRKLHKLRPQLLTILNDPIECNGQDSV